MNNFLTEKETKDHIEKCIVRAEDIEQLSKDVEAGCLMAGFEKVEQKYDSSFQWMDTDSPAWSAIVEYVLDHKDDIENGINDFETLKPVLDFFNRNCEDKS